MDMHSALKPVHMFWKFTGIANYSLTMSQSNHPKYIVVRGDRLLSVGIITMLVIVNITNVIYSLRFDNVLLITEMMKRCSYTGSTLSSLITMYYHREDVIQSMENLVDINNRVELETATRNNYGKTRRDIIMIILVYMVLVVMAFMNDVLYENPVAHFPTIYFVYYYTYYIVTASGLTMLLFFLIELRKMFRALNNYLEADIYKINKVHVDRIQKLKLKVEELSRIGRLLLTTSKRVNKIFQVLLLGKITTTWLFTLGVAFKLTSNSVLSLKYYKEVYVIWSAAHILEILAAIKLFTSVRKEVTCHYCFVLLLILKLNLKKLYKPI